MLRLASLVLLVLPVIAGALSAQRPPATSNRAPAPRPPASRATPPARTAGHATAAARKAQAARQLEAERRRGVRSDGRRRPRDGAPLGGGGAGRPVGGGGVLPDRGAVRRFAAAEHARRERDFLAKLRNRVIRTRDETRELDIRTFAGGDSRRFKLYYAGLRLPDGQLRHRVTVREVKDGRESFVDRLVIEEHPGELPRAWHTDGGKSVPYVGNALLYPIGGKGHPLALIDVLPFHPDRYRLELVGEGERDGRPVLHFNARPMSARRESQDLVFRKITYLLVRQVAHSKGRVTRQIGDSALKRFAGVLGFTRRSVRFSSGELATVSLIARRINSKLDPGLFDPSKLAR